MPWTDGLPAEEITQAQAKGWDKLEGDALGKALFTSYRGLEKLSGTLRGTPVERILTLPEGTDPEAWKPVWQRLGVPDDPAKYELGDNERAKAIAAAAGLTVSQAKKLAEQLTTLDSTSATEAAAAAKTAADNKLVEDARIGAQTREANEGVLRNTWGADYEKLMTAAKKVAGILGYAAEDVNAILTSQRGAPHMLAWAKMSQGMGEAGFAGIGNTGGPGTVVRDAPTIQAEIDEIITKNFNTMLTPEVMAETQKKMAELSRELVVAQRSAQRL